MLWILLMKIFWAIHEVPCGMRTSIQNSCAYIGQSRIGRSIESMDLKEQRNFMQGDQSKTWHRDLYMENFQVVSISPDLQGEKSKATFRACGDRVLTECA